MKRVIREGVFETNSSSTHSIAISKSDKYTIPKKVHFGIDEFGWEHATLSTVGKRAAYLYTALLCLDRFDAIPHFRKVLGAANVKCTFERPIIHEYGEEKKWRCVKGAYVDHARELKDFLDYVLSCKDNLFRYLFSAESVIHTGNDNSEIRLPPCDKPEQFDYFYKGN